MVGGSPSVGGFCTKCGYWEEKPRWGERGAIVTNRVV